MLLVLQTMFYIQHLDWVRGSKSANFLLSGALNLAADEFKYSLLADDSVDAFFEFKSKIREREGSLLKRLKKEVSAVTENNDTVTSWLRYLLGAMCGCLSYVVASFFWTAAMSSPGSSNF